MPTFKQLAEADEYLQRVRNILERMEIPQLTFNPAAWELLELDATELVQLTSAIRAILRGK
jgi:hypothetical protein